MDTTSGMGTTSETEGRHQITSIIVEQGTSPESLGGSYILMHDQYGSVAFWLEVSGSNTGIVDSSVADRHVTIASLESTDGSPEISQKIADAINNDASFKAEVTPDQQILVTDNEVGLREAATHNTGIIKIETIQFGAQPPPSGGGVPQSGWKPYTANHCWWKETVTGSGYWKKTNSYDRDGCFSINRCSHSSTSGNIENIVDQEFDSCYKWTLSPDDIATIHEYEINDNSGRKIKIYTHDGSGVNCPAGWSLLNYNKARDHLGLCKMLAGDEIVQLENGRVTYIGPYGKCHMTTTETDLPTHYFCTNI
jgi:hypothetical protein